MYARLISVTDNHDRFISHSTHTPAGDASSSGSSINSSPLTHPHNSPNQQPQPITSSAEQIAMSSLDIADFNRKELLHQANQWLNQKNVPVLTTLLQNYLKRHPQDIEFLLIEAKLKIETGLLSDAIIHYYSLLRQPMTALQQQHIEEQINKLSTQTINQLKSTYSWDLLAEFLEPLLQVEPGNRLYILSLARAYAEQLQQTLMENVLAGLSFDDPSATAIRQRFLNQQTRIAQAESDEDQVHYPNSAKELSQPISLLQYGDQFVVEAQLAGHDIPLLIDTGASITTISTRSYKTITKRTKAKFIGRFTVNTAGGTMRAPMYKFANLRINHTSVENVSVVVLPMNGLNNASGLLGMNFLREFDFKIDQRQALMYID